MFINGYVKALGAICIAAVLCAMYSGALAVGVMVVAALPLAIICRRKMDSEERELDALLKTRQAGCTLRYDCFEGIDSIGKGDPCTLFFVRKGIEVDCNGKTHLIPVSRIQKLDIYTLPEILEIAQSERRIALGALGEAMAFSTREKDKHRVSQQKNVRYLVVTLSDIYANISYLSFFAPAEYYHYNALGIRKENPCSYFSAQK